MNELSLLGGFVALCIGHSFWNEDPKDWSLKRRAFVSVIVLIVIALLGAMLGLDFKPVEYLSSSFLGAAMGTIYKALEI